MKKVLNDIPTVLNIRGIQSKTIIDITSITMKNLILGSEESIPPHEVPVDVTFYILDGSGRITISDNIYDVQKDDIIICPPNTTMSIIANQEGLSFLNIKTPGIKVTK
ncbi:MAG: cupin domain-containing protein [Acholeplasmataceae bacterium]